MLRSILLPGLAGVQSLVMGVPGSLLPALWISSREAHSVVKSTRPISGYILFAKDQFAKAKDSNASAQLKDIGNKWTSLSPSEKQQWLDTAAKLNVPLLKKREAVKAVEKIDQEERAAKHANKYNRFVKAQYAEVKAADPTIAPKDMMAKIASKWKALSPEEKEAFKPAA